MLSAFSPCSAPALNVGLQYTVHHWQIKLFVNITHLILFTEWPFGEIYKISWTSYMACAAAKNFAYVPDLAYYSSNFQKRFCSASDWSIWYICRQIPWLHKSAGILVIMSRFTEGDILVLPCPSVICLLLRFPHNILRKNKAGLIKFGTKVHHLRG